MIIDDQNKRAIDVLTQLRDGGYQTILITGGVWVGKTYLAREIFQGYFIDEPHFKQHIVAGNARLRSPEEYSCWLDFFPLEAIAKYPSVIYDDIGSVDCNETYIEKTLYWLNERLKRKDANGKPFRTVITTNLSVDQLEAREKRIFSRIMENCVIITMGWHDRRELNTRAISV